MAWNIYESAMNWAAEIEPLVTKYLLIKLPEVIIGMNINVIVIGIETETLYASD